MTKVTSKLIGMTILVVMLVAMFALAISVNAAERNTAERDRGEDSRTILTPPPEEEEPVAEEPELPPSNNSTGGITNVTTGEVESGGNTGGNVTTGDENVEISIVNVGPVNTSNGVAVTSGGQSDPLPSEPTCSSDRRDSNACSGDSSRAR